MAKLFPRGIGKPQALILAPEFGKAIFEFLAMAAAKVERLRVQVLCLTVAVITLPAVWMWTQSGVYPYLWKHGTGTWRYLIGQRNGMPLFLDYATGSVR